MTFAFGTTITVRRASPGGKDKYGDPIASTDTTTSIPGCAVAPRYSTEPAERGRQGVIVGKTLYAPFGSDIIFSDRVVVDGVEYRIDGEPGSWQHPMTGWRAGMEIALVRAAG